MDRHKPDTVSRLLIAYVGGTYQSNILKVRTERNHRIVIIIQVILRHNFLLGNHILRILCIPLLDKKFDAVEQFLDIGEPRLSFDRHVRLEKSPKAAVLQHGIRHSPSIFGGHPHRVLRNLVTECAKPRNCSRLKSVCFKIRLIYGLEKRRFVIVRGCGKSGKRCVPDASGRLVHYTLETFIVIDVHRQFEIRHSVLNLSPFIERISRIYFIGHIPLAKRLLQGTGLRICPV